MISGPTIVRADRAQADELARIHHAALADDFLPSLGLDFLERVYYPATFESTHGVHLIALDAGAAIGFVTVAHDTTAFTSDVLRGRGLTLAWFALRAAARNPVHLRLSVGVLWSVVSKPPDPIAGEIVLIAVQASCRGSGVGKALVSAAIEYLSDRHVPRCRTKTLASNADVIGMYRSLGWNVRNRFRLIGREYVTIVSPGS
jgi:ribosomal protein S18 acetylase RimI-like enzyme